MNQPNRFGLGGGRPNRRPGLFGSLLRHMLTILGVIVLLWFSGFLRLPGFDAKLPLMPAQGPPLAQDQAAAPPAGVEQVTTASIHRQQLAAARVAQRQLVANYDETKRAIDEWEKELTGWESEGPPLLKSEDGKRIATDPGQARRFRGIIRQTRPTSGELAAARQSAEDLISPIREALKNPEDASTPDASLTSTLQTLQTKAREGRDGYREARMAVRAMLAQVKGTAAGERTLEEAIAALDQEDASERAAAIDAAEKKAKDEGARKVAEEKAQLAKEIADAEAARIRDEAARKKQEAELAAAKTVEEMRLRQKQAEAELTRLQAEAEKKRQGDLTPGAKFKGEYVFNNTSCKATLSVISRSGDDIKVNLTTDGYSTNNIDMSGRVAGTTLRLMLPGSQVNTDPVVFRYDPSRRAISGSCPRYAGDMWSGAVNVRFFEEKDR